MGEGSTTSKVSGAKRNVSFICVKKPLVPKTRNTEVKEGDFLYKSGLLNFFFLSVTLHNERFFTIKRSTRKKKKKITSSHSRPLIRHESFLLFVRDDRGPGVSPYWNLVPCLAVPKEIVDGN